MLLAMQAKREKCVKYVTKLFLCNNCTVLAGQVKMYEMCGSISNINYKDASISTFCLAFSVNLVSWISEYDSLLFLDARKLARPGQSAGC